MSKSQWINWTGVLWNPPNGDPLRRARFTHGTQFQTELGEFYIDSEGSARDIPRHQPRVAPEERVERGRSLANHSGTEIRLEGDEHLTIREDDVLAVLE